MAASIHPVGVGHILQTDWCPSRNRQIWLRTRRAKIFTAGIWLIFRGKKYLRNAGVEQIGHLWMGTVAAIASSGKPCLDNGAR
jgi:hypothetical protein